MNLKRRADGSKYHYCDNLSCFSEIDGDMYMLAKACEGGPVLCETCYMLSLTREDREAKEDG